MIRTLASLLEIPEQNVIPYADWVQQVHEADSLKLCENPAKQLHDFFAVDFVRMSCGGLVLDTKRSLEHSKTLRMSTVVDKELVARYIQKWQEDEFLQ